VVLKVRVAQHLLTLLLDDRIRPLSPMTLVMLILSGMTARIVIQIHYRAACAPVPSLRHPLNGFKAMTHVLWFTSPDNWKNLFDSVPFGHSAVEMAIDKESKW
jgi:hypothetical protein